MLHSHKMTPNVHFGPFHDVTRKVGIGIFGNVTMRDRFL